MQPSLGPLAMAVCQRSLQCARLVTAICSSDTAGEQKEKYHEVRLIKMEVVNYLHTVCMDAHVNCLTVVLVRTS